MPKLAVVYLSTQGSTKMMAEAISEGARERHVEVTVDNFFEWDPEEAASADGIAVGSSTFNYTMHPPIAKFIDKMIDAGVEGKVGAAFGSYGWSGEAPDRIFDTMKNIFHMDMLSGPLRLKATSLGGGIQMAQDYGRQVAAKL